MNVSSSGESLLCNKYTPSKNIALLKAVGITQQLNNNYYTYNNKESFKFWFKKQYTKHFSKILFTYADIDVQKSEKRIITKFLM